MILKKKRIRTLKNNAPFLKDGEKFVVGLRAPAAFAEQMKAIGFAEKPEVGDTVLPPGDFGPISRYNADGKELVHKDRPMETAYRWGEWRWTEWHGPYPVEQSKFVDIPYKRYPRTYIEPVGVELSILSDVNGELILAAGPFTNTPGDEEANIHVINLLLEIFGECHFFTDDLNQIIKVPLRRLNWQLLPHGERPWPALRKELKSVVSSAPEGKRTVIEHRLETINKHEPSFAAVGHGGFHGYVVLGFPKLDIFVLESLLYGNATYVFDTNWERLSQLTKKEILDDKLQKDRIIHRDGWVERMRKLLRTAV